MFTRHKTSLVAMAALIAITLSGCGGGGGGGGGSGSGPMTGMPDPEPLDAAILDAIGIAAAARPAAANLTQSSNVDSNGVTIDQVEVSAQYDETNGLCFAIQNGTQWSIGLDDDRRLIPDLPSPWRGVEMEKRTDAGTVSVIAYSDITGGSDTDYLAGGIWLYVPDDVTDAGSYAAGAFADGSDPFRQENILALQGTATYEGYAVGTYALQSGASPDMDVFDAAVSLTADFGAENGLGTVSGSITNVEVDGESLDATLNLGTAAIGSTDSGFFEGQATGTANGLALEGKWGGRFFGNGAAADTPGSVAGTFGGHSTDNVANFVGVFGAHGQ